MRICFTGLDGSGKSTQSMKLLNTLNEKKIDVVYRHQFRYESESVMKWKDKLRPFIKRAQYLFCIDDSILIDAPFLKVIRDNIVWRTIRYPLSQMIALGILYSGVRKAKNKYKKYGVHDVFIMDRCFFDEVVRIEWKLNIRIPFRSIWLRSAPVPELVIYFDIPGDKSWERMDPKDTGKLPMILKEKAYKRLIPCYKKLTKVRVINIEAKSIEEVASIVNDEYNRAFLGKANGCS